MTIRIPHDLDEANILAVPERVNLTKTGQKCFGIKEITASLRWARVPLPEIHRFVNAVGQHGLFREPDPIPRRIPWCGPRHILTKP